MSKLSEKLVAHYGYLPDTFHYDLNAEGDTVCRTCGEVMRFSDRITSLSGMLRAQSRRTEKHMFTCPNPPGRRAE